MKAVPLSQPGDWNRQAVPIRARTISPPAADGPLGLLVGNSRLKGYGSKQDTEVKEPGRWSPVIR